jgi:hypothetical protein
MKIYGTLLIIMYIRRKQIYIEVRYITIPQTKHLNTPTQTNNFRGDMLVMI